MDGPGNRTLIAAARWPVEHLILVSVHGAAPDHPLGLIRMTYRTEREPRASDLAWTIVRPTASMETWAELVGVPLLAQ